MSATMKWSVVSGVLISVHGEAPPSSEEWAGYMATSRERAHSLIANLVVTDGGGPNATQRKMIADIAEIQSMPTAVVTSSLMARGIVTAIRWMGKNIRAFAPDNLDAALGYLALPPALRGAVCAAVAQHKAELIGCTIESLASSGIAPSGMSIQDFVIGEAASSVRRKLDQRSRAR